MSVDDARWSAAYEACRGCAGFSALCLGLPEFEQHGNTDNEIQVKTRTAYRSGPRRLQDSIIREGDEVLSHLDAWLYRF